MVNRILAPLCAIMIAALFAASGITGCDGDNGVVTTDDVIEDTNSLCPSGYYLADNYWCLPLDTGSDDSTAIETTEDPCAPFANYEGKTWVCYETQDYYCHNSTFWIEEDEESGAEYCVIGCTQPSVFHFWRTDQLEWGLNSFVIPADYYPAIPCNLVEE